MRPKIVVESPFRASSGHSHRDNVDLAEMACRYVVLRGGNPYASHLFFTRFLSDAIDDERQLGITLGLEWGMLADEAWFFFRRGEMFSIGMAQAYSKHFNDGTPIRVFSTKDEGFSWMEEIDMRDVVPKPPASFDFPKKSLRELERER